MISIRQMQKNDESQIVALMQKFYASSAVWSNGSEEIFRADVRECVGDSPYARGYVFECDGKMAGYGILAFGFSTEFGKKCVWIEDIYVKEEFRGMKLGSRFLDLCNESFLNSCIALNWRKKMRRLCTSIIARDFVNCRIYQCFEMGTFNAKKMD